MPSSGAHEGEAWLIGFRVVQGAFGALLFPAALAIVAASFEARERGKTLAIFLGITGGLTSVGPLAGGYLIEWTWRSIFWINVPVALVALVLTLHSRPADERRDTTIDRPGAVLVCGAMGLIVLGLQQSSQWGWGSAATWGCVVAGLLLLVAFARLELRVAAPLIETRIFADRGFAADNLVLFLLCVCFVPLFFFASVYAQAVLQTVRYFASSLGLAVLGTVFVNRNGGGAHIAEATQTVYRSMAGVMVVCLAVAVLGMRNGPAVEG